MMSVSDPNALSRTRPELANHQMPTTIGGVGIDVHTILELVLSLPQHEHLKHREPRGRAVVTTILSVLEDAADACKDVLNVHQELPDLYCPINPQSIGNVSSYHTTLALTYLSYLFPRIADSTASPCYCEKSKLQKNPHKYPTTTLHGAATLYMFLTLPAHLASAVMGAPSFTNESLLHDFPGAPGRRRFLVGQAANPFGTLSQAGGEHGLDTSLYSFRTFSDKVRKLEIWKRFEDDVGWASAMTKDLLRVSLPTNSVCTPTDPKQRCHGPSFPLPPKDDWNFDLAERTGTGPTYYTLVRDPSEQFLTSTPTYS